MRELRLDSLAFHPNSEDFGETGFSNQNYPDPQEINGMFVHNPPLVTPDALIQTGTSTEEQKNRELTPEEVENAISKGGYDPRYIDTGEE